MKITPQRVHPRRYALLCFTLVAWVLCVPVYAQLAVGQWKSHLTHRQGQAVALSPTHAYMLSERGVAGYNLATGEYREFSTVEGLSSVDVAALHYDPTSNAFFVGYRNGIIDYFTSPDQIQTVRDINLSTTVTDKQINGFVSAGNSVYVATNFGVVVFDPARREIKASYTKIGDNLAYAAVSGLVIYGNRIWALTPNGPYSASLAAPNLADGASWQLEAGRQGLPNGTHNYRLAASNSDFFVAQQDTIYRYDTGSGLFLPVRTGQISNLTSNANHVMLISGIDVYQLDSQGETRLTDSNDPKAATLSADGALLVIADAVKGLVLVQNNERLQPTPTALASNSCNQVTVTPSYVYVSPNPQTRFFVPGSNLGAYALDRTTQEWQLISHENGRLSQPMSIVNASYDALSRRTFLSAWGYGVVELDGLTAVNYYNPTNSTISAEANGAAYVSDVRFDSRGQMWVSQFLTNSTSAGQPLSVRSTDGTWSRFGMAGGIPVKFGSALLTDASQSVWMSVFQNGISVLDTRGTLAVSSDDRYRKLSSGVGQGNLGDNSVNAMVEDRTGAIWVGTNNGISVFYSPFSVFNANSSADAVCPINTGQCLLRNEVVQALAIDGANRKWVGTNRGLFLFSADGTQLIAQYDTENSPLFSNDIKDIAVDPQTGTVYIATSLGLIAYGGTSTEGGDECADIELYPNPVFADFDGQIALRGTTDAAAVKITTAAGYLVADLPANGGMATWNGRDYQGNRVVPGVYIVHIAKADGSGSCVGKIAILPRP